MHRRSVHLPICISSIPDTKLNARRFSGEDVVGAVESLVLVLDMNDYTIGLPDNGVGIPFSTINMEVSRGIVAKVNIATMGDTRRARALSMPEIIVLLNARWLGIEIMGSPEKVV